GGERGGAGGVVVVPVGEEDGADVGGLHAEFGDPGEHFGAGGFHAGVDRDEAAVRRLYEVGAGEVGPAHHAVDAGGDLEDVGLGHGAGLEGGVAGARQSCDSSDRAARMPMALAVAWVSMWLMLTCQRTMPRP